MPSRRSRSPERRRHRSYSRSRSRSPARHAKLPYNVEAIGEDDYYLKNDEFRVWLKEDKGKYFNELSGDKARHYFRKFVKAWNRGKLSHSLYLGADSATANVSTSKYKWSFDKSQSRRRDEDDDFPSSRSVKGPTLPSSSDLTMAREFAAENAVHDAKLQRKRDRLEARDRVEDAIGPRAVGKEAILEKKREKAAGNRAFREGKEDAGLEVDEQTLMGGGDSFKAQIAKRDAARQRYQASREMKDMDMRERQSQRQEKEKATMDMFQKMAQQRFG
ncbi:hypothetical protein DL96DRAFT_1455451 [Flagelloscypha sp. PMI_526]|nr:hypothetical protein DL96DRAFT_1455451 [Flagelloscypha sp. PMI_526]